MNPLRQALFRLRWSLIHRGLRQTLRDALHPPPPQPFSTIIHPFDLEHHTDTSGTLPALELADPHPHSVYTTAYHAIPPSRLHAILDAWRDTPPLHPISQTTFLDLGCGKGRALLLASQLPFRHILGVELNPRLAHIAARNLELWQQAHPNAPPIEVLCQDATTVTFPPGPCRLDLYNPFAPALVARLIDHLVHTFASRPNQLDILYFTPDADPLFAAHPAFTTLWTRSIPISPQDAAAELPISVIDRCTAYRLPGTPPL
jgi:SAM-dependent methyltransferase